MATMALDDICSDFDPFDARTRIDPYPAYAELRARGACPPAREIRHLGRSAIRGGEGGIFRPRQFQ